MPGTPSPLIDPSMGPHWTAVLAAIQSLQQQVQALTAGATQFTIPDAYGNTMVIVGTNLAQNVTIGASHGQPGVQVATGIAAGTAGLAFQQALATGTITTTQGSTAATLNSTISGTFTSGQVIGAADVSDPRSGVATPAIIPGTTFTISGTAVTLSQPAAESGTGIFCASASFQTLAGLNYP